MRIVGLVTAVIVGAIFFWVLLASENEAAEEQAPERKVGHASQPVATGPEAPESQEPPPTMEIIYAHETAEPDGLVTYSDNVFVGQVLEAVGHEPWTSTIPGDEKPQTQWSVRVGEVLKSSGKAPVFRGGEVVVNQIGGPDPQSREPYVVQGVWEDGTIMTDRMMEPGESYLLATTYDPNGGWQAISAQPTGNQPLSHEEVSGEAVLNAFREAAAQTPSEAATEAPADASGQQVRQPEGD